MKDCISSSSAPAGFRVVRRLGAATGVPAASATGAAASAVAAGFRVVRRFGASATGSGGVAAEAERSLLNLAAVLGEVGLGLRDIVKTTIYLVDMADFAAVNEVYARHFQAPFPARATVAVAGLPKDGRVEIEAIAAAA